MPGFFDIIDAGADTPLFVTVLPNTRNNPDIPIRWMRARNAAELEQFIAKHDRPGAAIYFAVAQLKDGATTRSAETVARTRWIWGEIDFRDHSGISADEIHHRLTTMPRAPTLIVHSGHGFHCYWALRTPEDLTTDDGQHHVREALKLACAHIGGDPHVAEVARLMRVPGSTNSKYGDSIRVEIASYAPERAYSLDDLIDYFLDASAILPEPAGQATNGHDRREDTFTEYATAFHKPHVDVEQRLADMKWQAPGEQGMHATQLSCTASLLKSGMLADDVVERVLQATRDCAARDPRCAGWDRWDEARTTIQEMTYSWVNKHPDLSSQLPEALRIPFEQRLAEGLRPKITPNKKHGFHVRGYEQHEAAPGKTEKTEPASAEKDGKKPARPPRVTAKPYHYVDPATIPPRDWLLGKHYMCGIVSATIAPGGAGKSSLDLVDAIALATGQRLHSDQPKARYRVWYHNGEDPPQEVQRRIAAICQHYGVDAHILEETLYVTSGLDMPIKITRSNGTTIVHTETIKEIIETIDTNEIDIAIFDPLITLHSSPEVDNNMMDAVVREFARVAFVTDAAVELSHHTRKRAAGQDDLTAADARGASAIIDAVRLSRVLNTMNPAEAEKRGFSDVERLFYFRVDSGKRNLAPPSAARWYKFESVTIANGDEVGVVAQWTPPDIATNITTADKAWIQAELARDDWRMDQRAHAWVGNLIAQRLNLSADGWQVKQAVDDLKREGVILRQTAGQERLNPPRIRLRRARAMEAMSTPIQPARLCLRRCEGATFANFRNPRAKVRRCEGAKVPYI
jgi:AAA domain